MDLCLQFSLPTKYHCNPVVRRVRLFFDTVFDGIIDDWSQDWLNVGLATDCQTKGFDIQSWT